LAYSLVHQLGASALRVYPHGLFAALVPPYRWSEDEVAALAGQLAVDLSRQGLPVRHAGSFGFDFMAVEAFFDTEINRPVTRIAVGDLPSMTYTRVADAIAGWWARLITMRECHPASDKNHFVGPHFAPYSPPAGRSVGAWAAAPIIGREHSQRCGKATSPDPCGGNADAP
jgi:hypothetical protein